MKRIMTALGLAGAFALVGLAVATTGAATPTTTLGVCNPGWYVNPDEVTRKPTPTPAGMKFEGNQLIHHAVANMPVALLTPGTYVAAPAPDQPSFFSVEVRNPSGAYGTLRWNPTTSKWSITIGAGTGPDGAATAGTFENASPVALLTGKVTKWGAFALGSNVVVSFGVGYTNSPPGTVAAVVSSVSFKGVTYDLKCILPTSSSSSSTSATPSASSSSSKPPSSSASQSSSAPPTSASASASVSASITPPVVARPPSGLALTGTPVAAVAGLGVALVLAGGALVAWLWRRNRVEFES